MPSDRPVPAPFAAACERLRHLVYRPEFTVREAPGPARLAPFSFAQTADIDRHDEPVGSGRLVILHDPVGQESWEGTTRVIAYVDADIDIEMASDPVLPEVGWTWLLEALEDADVQVDALGGTVTSVVSESFGVMDDRPLEARLQVRASWTPRGTELTPHANAWALLAAAACALPDTTPGVTQLR